MTTSTWSQTPAINNKYDVSGNWNEGLPDDVACFGISDQSNNDIDAQVKIGEWLFGSVSSDYNFTVENSFSVDFVGGGIEVNGGSCHIFVFGFLVFNNYSSAGRAVIENDSTIDFFDIS